MAAVPPVRSSETDDVGAIQPQLALRQRQIENRGFMGHIIEVEIVDRDGVGVIRGIGETRGRAIVPVACVGLSLLLVVMVVANHRSLSRELELWRRFESLGRNRFGLREYRHRATGIVFIYLPGGDTWLGSPQSESERADGEELRRVRLSPFLLAKYETTRAEWGVVMGESASVEEHRDLPVTDVNWNDCAAFCSAAGFALPSDAQWEYACRAGSSGQFAFGETLDESCANVSGTSRSARWEPPLPAQSLVPNRFGFHHLHGNVREWCEDAWDVGFASSEDARGPDPVCRGGMPFRVIRGGSWVDPPSYCRSAFRSGYHERLSLPYIGFRPAFRLR